MKRINNFTLSFREKLAVFQGLALVIVISFVIYSEHRSVYKNGSDFLDQWVEIEKFNFQEGHLLESVSKLNKMNQFSNKISTVFLVEIKTNQVLIQYGKDVPFEKINWQLQSSGASTFFCGIFEPCIFKRVKIGDSDYGIVISVKFDDAATLSFFFTSAIMLLFILAFAALELLYQNSYRESLKKINKDLIELIELNSESRNVLDIPSKVDVLLRNSFKMLITRFEQMAALEAKSITDKIRFENASQVAHDIRSPLAALEMITNTTKELPEEKRLLIRNAVSRIRDIANDLLNQNRKVSKGEKANNIAEEQLKVELLQSLLDPLLTEKRLQFRSRLGIEIIAQIDIEGYGLFAKIQPREFKRVMSNLVNNSVEACTVSGTVTVTLRQQDQSILIEISDNGKGIPPNILEKLGTIGETHGKEGGSGLGFYHAKKNVEVWGGRLSIISQVGLGTTVSIGLPQAKIPNWFVPKIVLSPNNHFVVVLDDDSSIHQIWRGRFESAIANDNRVQLLHFSTEVEITEWKRNLISSHEHIVYLVDYELLGQNKTGLDIIISLGIAKTAILVTSRYEEEAIRNRCVQNGIKMIPKGLAGFVPIEVQAANPETFNIKNLRDYEECDCILIDDDKMVRMTWGIAASEAKKVLKTFCSPTEFFEVAKTLNPRTPLYIDSQLGEGIRGETIAQEIFDKFGFIEIYLATGSTASSFDLSKMPYLKGITGKDNPWG